MSDLTVLVDLDSICADLLTPWIEAYNTEFGGNMTIADVTTFRITDLFRKDVQKQAYEIIERVGFFRDLPPIAGAINTVAAMKALGHKVLFCSSPATPWCAQEKYAWIDEHYGPYGFSDRDVILASQKWYVQGDILIDDRPSTAVKYKEKWPGAKVLSIEFPYNQGSPAFDLLADGWDDTENAWMTILEHVNHYADPLNRT